MSTLRLRADLLARARSWFAARNLLEVQTSALCPAAVTDTQIASIAVPLQSGTEMRYLHSSPEYQMKRLLASGAPDIYQICRVFRDGEAGARHQPEFTLIEWYRLSFALDAIIDDTGCLIEALLKDHLPLKPACTVSYAQAFESAVGLDPHSASDAELEAAADRAGLPRDLDRDGRLDGLLVTGVAPGFATDALTVVFGYPASQAALARISPGDDRTAERFEVFFGELELANGFVELTDAAEQRTRFENDLAVRRRRGARAADVDEAFLAALEAGLPACAGVAVGFDRVVMLAANQPDIRKVQAFPIFPPSTCGTQI